MGHSLQPPLHSAFINIPNEEDNVKKPSESQPQHGVSIDIPAEEDNVKKPSEDLLILPCPDLELHLSGDEFLSYLHGYNICRQYGYAVLGIGQTRFLVKSWRRYAISLKLDMTYRTMKQAMRKIEASSDLSRKDHMRSQKHYEKEHTSLETATGTSCREHGTSATLRNAMCMKRKNLSHAR
ncbi:hypothetical protein Tco_1218900 [Tanacetum coccineum]